MAFSQKKIAVDDHLEKLIKFLLNYFKCKVQDRNFKKENICTNINRKITNQQKNFEERWNENYLDKYVFLVQVFIKLRFNYGFIFNEEYASLYSYILLFAKKVLQSFN